MLKGQLNWWQSAIALGITFLIAVWLVKPIGVSTQFVIADGLIASAFNDELIQKDAEAKHGYTSTNPYLDKSGGKYAKAVTNPINYSFVFVIAIAVGAWLSSVTGGPVKNQGDSNAPLVWRENFAKHGWMRLAATFVGGILVLYGSRLAGGCTSGHMMSGIMQTSLSGYLFMLGAFATAIPTALLLYKK